MGYTVSRNTTVASHIINIQLVRQVTRCVRRSTMIMHQETLNSALRHHDGHLRVAADLPDEIQMCGQNVSVQVPVVESTEATSVLRQLLFRCVSLCIDHCILK